MDEVAPGLFVGTRAAATAEQLRHDHGVTAVVSLTHDDVAAAAVTVANVPMSDGPRCDRGAFDRAVTETVARLDAGDPVLVHCAAGSSRSPAVAATALALHEGWELAAAFEQVVDRREGADPHDALVQQAASVYVERR